MKKKEEALKRMRALKLIPECIVAFEENNEVWISENDGILFDLSQQPVIREKIKEFENKHEALVYHCIKTYTEFGILITMFYVSNYSDEWQMDWDDMKENYACCYVCNLDDEACSDIGSIAYQPMNGGLKRTA